MFCFALLCIIFALCYIVPLYIALHHFALHCFVLHCCASFRIDLLCTASHRFVLHCISFHCLAFAVPCFWQQKHQNTVPTINKFKNRLDFGVLGRETGLRTQGTGETSRDARYEKLFSNTPCIREIGPAGDCVSPTVWFIVRTLQASLIVGTKASVIFCGSPGPWPPMAPSVMGVLLPLASSFSAAFSCSLLGG